MAKQDWKVGTEYEGYGLATSVTVNENICDAVIVTFNNKDKVLFTWNGFNWIEE